MCSSAFSFCLQGVHGLPDESSHNLEVAPLSDISDLLCVEVRQGMTHHHQRQVGKTQRLRPHPGVAFEGDSHERDCRNFKPFQTNGVVDTPRRAGASIPERNEDRLYLARHLGQHLGGRSPGGSGSFTLLPQTDIEGWVVAQ